MNDMFAHVTIRILEKEYQVACPADEKADLMASAEMLNKKMREIRDSGKVVGLDRVAVMAALNLANELLKTTGDGQAVQIRAAGVGTNINNQAVEGLREDVVQGCVQFSHALPEIFVVVGEAVDAQVADVVGQQAESDFAVNVAGEWRLQVVVFHDFTGA